MAREVPFDLLVKRRKVPLMSRQDVPIAAPDHACKLRGHFRPDLTGSEQDLMGNAFSKGLEISPAQFAGAPGSQPIDLPEYDLREGVAVPMWPAKTQRPLIEAPSVSPF